MHSHSEPAEMDRLKEASFITIAGGVCNAILAAGKIGIGSITGYLPLTASGFHSLSDIVSDVITWFTLLLGSRSADLKFHYGYRRIETLVSLFAAFFLVFVSVELITESFNGHDHGHGLPAAVTEHVTEHNAEGHNPEVHSNDQHNDNEHMKKKAIEEHHDEDSHAASEGILLIFLASLVSVIIKEILFRLTRRKGISLNSPMLIAKAWHHRADSVSSAAVILSIFISFLFPTLELVDQITTIIISGLILHSAWSVGITAIKELIDFAPSLKTTSLIEELASKIQGVTFTHGIRIRTMGGALYIELTAETDPDLTIAQGYSITEKIREEVMGKIPNVIDVTTIIAPKGEYLRSFLASEA